MSKSLGNVTAPAGGDRALRRRHPAALGDEHRRHRGPAHRPGDPEAAGGALPPHPQHAALAARRPRRLLGRRAPAARRAAGAGALGAAPAGGAGRAACAAPSPRTTGPAWCPELHGFCDNDLSRLLLRHPQGRALLRRRRTARGAAPSRTVLDLLHRHLCAWLAPVLVFTAEEAWLARFGGEEESVHLHDFPAVPAEWRDEALAEKWARVREARRAVTRRAGGGQRAPATLVRPCRRPDHLHRRNPTAGLLPTRRPGQRCCIVSEVDGRARSSGRTGGGHHRRSSRRAPGAKCARCWRVLPEVGRSAAHPGLCLRCEAVVEAQERTPAAA